MEIQTTIEVPDELEFAHIKYEPTGEVRWPHVGEAYLSSCRTKIFFGAALTGDCVIYRKKQWRAEYGEQIFFVDSLLYVQNANDYNNRTYLFEAGNYFQHRSDAELCAERIKQAITDFRDEAGI